MQDTKGELQVEIKLVRPWIGQVRLHLKLVRPYFWVMFDLIQAGFDHGHIDTVINQKLAKYGMILRDASLIIYKYNWFIIEVNAWVFDYEKNTRHYVKQLGFEQMNVRFLPDWLDD